MCDRRRIGKFTYPIILALLLYFSDFSGDACAAEEFSLKAEVDREKVSVGEEFNYSLALVGKGVRITLKPEPPDFTGFELLGTSS